jgi:hypothetical protein
MTDLEIKMKKIEEIESAVKDLTSDMTKLREAFMESDIDIYDKLFTLDQAIATMKKLARES